MVYEEGRRRFALRSAAPVRPTTEGRTPSGDLGGRLVGGEAWTRPLGPLDLVELAVDGGTLEPGFTPTATRYRIAVRVRDPAGWGADDTGVRLRVRARPARDHTPVLITSSTGEVVQDSRDVGRFTGAVGTTHHLTIALGDPCGSVRTVSLCLDLPAPGLPG